MSQPTASELIAIHGHQYALMIEDSLRFLIERETVWKLPAQLDRAEYIRLLVKRAKTAAVETEAAKKA